MKYEVEDHSEMGKAFGNGIAIGLRDPDTALCILSPDCGRVEQVGFSLRYCLIT